MNFTSLGRKNQFYVPRDVKFIFFPGEYIEFANDFYKPSVYKVLYTTRDAKGLLPRYENTPRERQSNAKKTSGFALGLITLLCRSLGQFSYLVCKSPFTPLVA